MTCKRTDSFYENSEGANDELINFISKPSFFPYKTVNYNKTTISHQKFNCTQKIKHGKTKNTVKISHNFSGQTKKIQLRLNKWKNIFVVTKKVLKTLPML